MFITYRGTQWGYIDVAGKSEAGLWDGVQACDMRTWVFRITHSLSENTCISVEPQRAEHGVQRTDWNFPGNLGL